MMRYLNQHFLTLLLVLLLPGFCPATTPKDDEPQPSNVSSEADEWLPAWLGDGFGTCVTEHFAVAHDGGPAEARELAGQLEYAFEYFRLYFEQFGYTLPMPQDRLNWISFSEPEHFLSYALRADQMNLSQLGGYYSARTNRVAIIGFRSKRHDNSEPVHTTHAVNTEGEIAGMAGIENPDKFIKIAHELAHQLAFNTGLQKRGVMYPLWASEGLATQYETKLSYCRQTNTARSDRLHEMCAQNRLIPLEQFISATRLPADKTRCEELYAQAWGFFDFLLKNHPDQLRAYLDALYRTDPGYRTPETLQQEFVDHFGELDTLQQEWIEALSGH